MGDAAVEFLLENLKQLLLDQANLIIGVKDDVEKLENDLRNFRNFLKLAIEQPRSDDIPRDDIRQIREAVYEAEDIIDTFVTEAIKHKSKSKNGCLKAIQKPMDLLSVAKDVKKVVAKIDEIRKSGILDFTRFSIRNGEPEKRQDLLVRQDNMVGFDDQVKMLLEYLTEETQELDVITITGMPGQGKTTLAQKVFSDPAISKEFPTHRIRVEVSQQFTRKNIFLEILKKVPIILTEDMKQKTDDELSQLVASHLEDKKFLIVMDDVWTTRDWDKLQTALPRKNKMGKVLITSRYNAVARHANRRRDPHQLRPLNDKESWLMLQTEVFGEPNCPSQLKDVGERIAMKCGGLPLQIVIIGGILLKMFNVSNVMSARAEAWEKVSERVTDYLKEDPERRMEKVISLSYDTLPFHLRPCFLYLGMFPEDFEIPVRKLIQMWIAEGFIQQKSGFTLEETAGNYFEELVDGNLVKTVKIKPDGKAKTCRIHDMLREFCRTEAGNVEESFLQEIKKSPDGCFEPEVSDVHKYRRLCIHSDLSEFLPPKPDGRHRVRSFVCFSKDDTDLDLENYSAIPAAFKLLRVLDMKPIKFTKDLPRNLYELVHMRYIALSFNSSTLSTAFSKFWNIQTLIVETRSPTLDIKADIWKLIQLRYLKTNASTTLPKPRESSKEPAKLQTLSTISPKSCTEEVFGRARNLKKLGIRGQLSLFFNGKTGSFDNLRILSNLEKLKLINDESPSWPSHSLPPAHQFPPKLRSLTLSSTLLDWDTQMSILGKLQKLQVLKLKHAAFRGEKWVVAEGGFRDLEVLHIECTELTLWEASSDHFPKLRLVELRNCEKLKHVPIELADIVTLEVLDLYQTKCAVASAKKIRDAKQNNLKRDATEFKLIIDPAEE